MSERNCITITTTINTSIEKVWEYWNEPKHITQWCVASPDWHTPKAINNLEIGGKFATSMAAKDGSFGFDFSGVYTEVKTNEIIAYTMDDGRTVRILFTPFENQIKIIETFEAEKENPIEMQQQGWQNILDSFKKYIENN
ncbi:MAG: polyketide cyclase [Flavobacterium sp.]|nr:polyketide cyclase [Flavobacterium sp.]